MLSPDSLGSHQEEPATAKEFFAILGIALPGAQNPWKPRSLVGALKHICSELGHLPFLGALHLENGVLIRQCRPQVPTGGIAGPGLGWLEDIEYWEAY